MPGRAPNDSPRGFDLYKYRAALMLGGAATAAFGELCVGGNAESVGDVLVYLGGIASGLGMSQIFQGEGRGSV